MTKMLPMQQQIRESAHAIWEERVREEGFPPDGYALDDWITAEQGLLFEMNYEALFENRLDKGVKEYIGSPTNRKCRYCGKTPPAVTFKSEAHAISHQLGNKSLIALDECDACNTLFSETGEDSLGKMLIPSRALLGIAGKKGVPTVRSNDKRFRLEHDRDAPGLLITNNGPTAVVRHDTDAGTMSADLPTQPYVPVRVLKGLTKMALAIMPEADLVHCKRTLEWLQTPDDTRWLSEIREGMTYYSFIPPDIPFLSVGLYKRTDAGSGMPAFIFVFFVRSLMLQTYVPLCDLDDNYAGKPLVAPRLGHAVYNPEGPTLWNVIPVASAVPTKVTVLEMVMRLDAPRFL